jgi:hypothetical protein
LGRGAGAAAGGDRGHREYDGGGEVEHLEPAGGEVEQVAGLGEPGREVGRREPAVPEQQAGDDRQQRYEPPPQHGHHGGDGEVDERARPVVAGRLVADRRQYESQAGHGQQYPVPAARPAQCRRAQPPEPGRKCSLFGHAPIVTTGDR